MESIAERSFSFYKRILNPRLSCFSVGFTGMGEQSSDGCPNLLAKLLNFVLKFRHTVSCIFSRIAGECRDYNLPHVISATHSSLGSSPIQFGRIFTRKTKADWLTWTLHRVYARM